MFLKFAAFFLDRQAVEVIQLIMYRYFLYAGLMHPLIQFVKQK